MCRGHRILFVHGRLVFLPAGLSHYLIVRFQRQIAGTSGAEGCVKFSFVNHAGHIRGQGRVGTIEHSMQMVPGDQIHAETEPHHIAQLSNSTLKASMGCSPIRSSSSSSAFFEASGPKVRSNLVLINPWCAPSAVIWTCMKRSSAVGPWLIQGWCCSTEANSVVARA